MRKTFYFINLFCILLLATSATTTNKKNSSLSSFEKKELINELQIGSSEHFHKLIFVSEEFNIQTGKYIYWYICSECGSKVEGSKPSGGSGSGSEGNPSREDQTEPDGNGTRHTYPTCYICGNNNKFENLPENKIIPLAYCQWENDVYGAFNHVDIWFCLKCKTFLYTPAPKDCIHH